jgi:hypothetical protein
MPVRIFALLTLGFLAATTLTTAQPLELGSTREQVMKILYRSGAHADTLTKESDLVMQVWMYPDTGITRRYSEVIRIAPVTMFMMEGYAALVFDSTGRLQSYRWMRRSMKGFVLGAGWEKIFTWGNDVGHERYLGIKRELDSVRANGRWTDYTPGREFASARWDDRGETVSLNWEKGGLVLDHERR